MFMHVTEMIYGQIEEQPVAGRGRWRLLYARQPAQPRVPALLPGYRALCRSSCLAIFCERKQLQATLASWPALSLTDSASCTGKQLLQGAAVPPSATGLDSVWHGYGDFWRIYGYREALL